MDAAAPSNSTNGPSSGDVAQASVVIVIGILVCFFSLLTVIVVHKFRSVSNPDILILALAVIDFISSFTVFPMAAYWYLRTGAYPLELCLVYGVLTTTTQLASTVIVSLMTVDRFLAIRRPILYRTRMGVPQLKRLVVITVVVSAVIGCLPAALSSTKWITVTNRHGYCTFQYSSDFTFVVLTICLPQIPLLFYCYYGFLVSIRKFIQRRQPHQAPSPASSTVSSEIDRKNNSTRPAASTASSLDTWISRCRICCCCCCCSICRAKQMKPVSREEMVERTQAVMKNLNLKRCTRMSKTVALVVLIYYIPWLLVLITMMIELITRVDNYSSGLDLVTVRLMMAHSIFYPAVYATLCRNYRQAYKWVLSRPFHPCGLEWHERPPLGISVSEMHRISHQMALEEWESPGLNRRLYSKRPYLKRSTTDSLKDAANVGSDAWQDNPAFERNEITSADQAAEDGQITVEIVHESASRRASVDDLAPSVSVHRIAPVESPPLPRRPRVREEKVQGGCVSRRPLENQTSDSGVDVDSIHLDSAPSGSNSPAVIRLQTVESESSTSVSDATEHLIQADDTRHKDTSFVLEPSDQDHVKSTHCAPNMDGNKTSDSCDEVIGTAAIDSDHYSNTKHEIFINDEGRSGHVCEKLENQKEGVKTENDDAGRYNIIVENGHIAAGANAETTFDTAEKSKLLDSDSTRYNIKETSPSRNSILRIEPCSAGEHCQGVVRIHVEVVELRPDSPPLARDTCTLQSRTRQCRVKSASQRPSLKFSMQKNRFVPSTSSFEDMDSYSLDLGGQNADTAKNTATAPQLNLPDANDSSQNGDVTDAETERETMATNGDVDESKASDDPPAKGFKSRRMRASRALRESARYEDDIVRFSEMIMRRQNEDKLAVKEEPKESQVSESLPVRDGSLVIVTDHIDL